MVKTKQSELILGYSCLLCLLVLSSQKNKQHLLLTTTPNKEILITIDIIFIEFFKRVFEALCHQEMPDLMKHLDDLTCELSPVTFNWFMTIFVDSLPIEVKEVIGKIVARNRFL